jgi:D-proline reductase (dithiol) PrdB
MPVDSFKFLPRLIAAVYQMTDRQPAYPIPWTPLTRPLSDCKFGLVTSAGLYHRGQDPPFNIEREKQEPTWGDPSFRCLPVDIAPHEVGAAHLHINTQTLLADINSVLPIQRFQKLIAAQEIGSLAGEAYAFMGYQGYPPDTTAWQETYGPQLVEKLRAENVDCVLLTPA